jgi:hypothetical protein
MAPHRAGDVVAVPDRGVGEADLAAHRALATGAAQVEHARGDGIGGGQVELGVVAAERRDLPAGAEQVDEVAGEAVEGFGGHG